MNSSNEIYILKEIHLSKPDAAANYGFCIKGGRKKALGIYVTDVIKNSLADVAGLQKDDILVRVNSVDFSTLTIDQAIEYLKTSNKVNLLLKRHLAKDAYYVELNRTDLKQTFGFLVDNIHDNVIYLNRLFVKMVHRDSIAFWGKLKPGDEIIQINNRFVRDCHYEEVYSMFKNSFKLKMLINSRSLNEMNSARLREENIDKMIDELSDIEDCNKVSSRKTSHLYDKIKKTKQNNSHISKTRPKDQSDKSIRIEYLINSLDDDDEEEDNILESTEISVNIESISDSKDRLYLPLTAEISYHPQQILNIETELVIPESPVRQELLEDYEYDTNAAAAAESEKFETSVVKYDSHRSKVVPDVARDQTSEGLVSIRLFKEPEWPKLFGLRLALVWNEQKEKKFLIEGYQPQSLAEKLKLFQIGSGIKKINENDLSRFDNVSEAEDLLENVYSFNRQITLLVEPINQSK